MRMRGVHGLALSLAVLAGCNGQLLNALQMGGLQFKPTTQERLNQFAGGSKSTSGDAAAPTAAPLAPMLGESGAQGMVARAYPIWGGAMGNYSVVTTEEATAEGMSGSFSEIQAKLQSLVSSFAADARLVSASGNTASAKDGIGESWNVSYWSPNQMQSLNVSVTPTQTLIFKQTWKLTELDTQGVMDSSKVLELVTAAIQDKTFKAVEEQIAETKPLMDLPVAVNTSEPAPPPPSMPVQPQEEELFEVPSGASWYFNLYQEDKRLVWNVNLNSTPVIMYARPMTEPAIAEGSSTGSSGSGEKPIAEPSAAPAPDYYVAGGYARVDAKTGEILSLYRPRKIWNSYGSGGVSVSAPTPTTK